MKVVVISGDKADRFIVDYVHCVEDLADKTFENAVVNTSYVDQNGHEIFKLLEDSYYDDDYDVFMVTVDFITSKQQEVLDDVKRHDILYVTPETTTFKSI